MVMMLEVAMTARRAVRRVDSMGFVVHAVEKRQNQAKSA
jgi:hypothetical protein